MSILGKIVALAFSFASAASVILLRNSEAQTVIAAIMAGGAVVAYELAAKHCA